MFEIMAFLALAVGALVVVAVIAVVGLLFKLDLLAFALQPGAWTVDEPRADWYSAAAYLDEELAEKTTAREVYVAYGDPAALVHYDKRFQAKYGYWRPVVDRSVTAFLACGDLAEGFARVRCPEPHELTYVDMDTLLANF